MDHRLLIIAKQRKEHRLLDAAVLLGPTSLGITTDSQFHYLEYECPKHVSMG